MVKELVSRRSPVLCLHSTDTEIIMKYDAPHSNIKSWLHTSLFILTTVLPFLINHPADEKQIDISAVIAISIQKM
ncbi:hypothetical protein BG621_06860 [Parasaccharibacter apium]|nr:hypothetical protein BG621_06860 [Parasaccharibacter apium]